MSLVLVASENNKLKLTEAIKYRNQVEIIIIMFNKNEVYLHEFPSLIGFAPVTNKQANLSSNLPFPILLSAISSCCPRLHIQFVVIKEV